MNLVLFTRDELTRPLPRSDRRAQHLLDVLRRSIGDTFDAGLINGPRGKGRLDAITVDALTLSFAWEQPPAPLAPVHLIVGLPRPQTARDILRDATTLGATRLSFVGTEKGDPNYAASTLWSSGEWYRHVLAGAEQAFAPSVPEVKHFPSLETALVTLPPEAERIALDNYEASAPLQPVAAHAPPSAGVILAIGAERGWSAGERDQLRRHGFTLRHLGSRVLRTETAVIAALAVVRAQQGWP